MKRLSLTLLTTLALFCVYRVYAVVLGPMTKMKVMPVAPPPAEISGGHASHAARDAARQFLAEQPWAQEAKFTWEQFDQKFIYFNEVGPVEGKGQIENKNQYRFRPFAMIVRNAAHPDEPPTVLAADEARVTFSKKIEQFGAGDSGDNRIIGAELDTGVLLTGPNGLLLRGRNFVFSEATRSLYSDEPLQFGFGPTPKSKSRFLCEAEGIAITLEAGNNDVLGKDLPHIVDFEHLTLRRNVKFEIDYENRGMLTPVRVTSEGSFEFNREQRQASFDQNVFVVQRTSRADQAPQHNTLNCERLELLFDEATAAPADSQTGAKRNRRQEMWDQKIHSLAGLTLHYVDASSPTAPGETVGRVRFASEENSLVAGMARVRFDALQGTLSITDPEKSQIERTDSESGTVTRILTRRMLIGLERIEELSPSEPKRAFQPVRRKFGAVDFVHCIGIGRLLHIEEATGRHLLDARWSEKLALNPDESASDQKTAPRLLELAGDVKIIQGLPDGLSQWLRADSLILTLPADVFQSLETTGVRKASQKTKTLPIRRAVAKGHVDFRGPQAMGETNSLDVLFTSGPPPVIENRRPPRERAAAAQEKARIEPPVWDLQRCQRIEAEVVIDPETMDSGVKTATVQGPFRIYRPELVKGATDQSNGPITIQGHKLLVTNEGQERQMVVLVGRMHGDKCVERARIEAGASALEGQQIDLNRAQSTMKVKGRTAVTWPLQGDLTGRKLQGPMLMNIGCTEGLTFNGLEATFSRNVVVRLQDESQLSCDELIVGLDRPWSFNSDDPRATRPDVSVVRSPGRVSVNMLEWEKSAMSRVVEAEFGAFELHPKEGDGSFRGSGPGTVKQWQRGSFHFAVTPEASASANRPAASAELPWNFVKLKFEGAVTGNMHQRFATFDDRVKAIYSPVGQARMEFERQQLSGDSESAKRAVWVGCDQLNLSLSEPKPGAESGFITLNAQGSVSLEAQKVQANAHQITYEAEKDICELRGRGDQMATVYFDDPQGRGSVPGRVIQINRNTGAHRIVEAGTVTGGR